MPTPSPSSSYIERIIGWSARNKFLVFLLVGALLAGGVYCLRPTPSPTCPTRK